MKILIIGNYGAGNIGDEMILMSLILGLNANISDAEFAIMTASKTETEKFLKEYFPDEFANGKFSFFSRMPFGARSMLRGVFNGELIETIRAYRKVDKAIVGGGGLFADDEFAFAAILWMVQIIPLILFKKKFVLFGIGVGPLNKWFSRFFTKLILGKASYLCVRDQFSAELLKALVKKEIHIAPDPVFLLSDIVPKGMISAANPCGNKEPYIVLSMKPWKNFNKAFYKKFSFVLDKIIEEFSVNIIFVPFQEKAVCDADIANKIFVQLKQKNNFFILPYTSALSEIHAVFKNAACVIAMRLHASFAAMLSNVPCFSLFYSEKSKALLEFQSQSEEPEAGNYIWINHFETNDFLAKFRDFWNKREQTKSACQKALFVVKDKILRSFSEFCSFLKT